ncbi:uncharacterized protein LOC110268443 [Arachis ipaensis]|uniref:uncharacterized protein LOC110268443 n=1 Tax=Arachis ipaensis TaxID=130454 RepID=UPI000A2B3EBD|nr:uncharacterized protein LOC110268443 [Arachis ipaensis]
MEPGVRSATRWAAVGPSPSSSKEQGRTTLGLREAEVVWCEVGGELFESPLLSRSAAATVSLTAVCRRPRKRESHDGAPLLFLQSRKKEARCEGEPSRFCRRRFTRRPCAPCSSAAAGRGGLASSVSHCRLRRNCRHGRRSSGLSFCHMRPCCRHRESMPVRVSNLVFVSCEIMGILLSRHVGFSHRCRSRVAAATGGGCWGYRPTGSEAVAVWFSRSFLVSELESGLLVPFGAVSAFESAGRAEILIAGDVGSR